MHLPERIPILRLSYWNLMNKTYTDLQQMFRIAAICWLLLLSWRSSTFSVVSVPVFNLMAANSKQVDGISGESNQQYLPVASCFIRAEQPKRFQTRLSKADLLHSLNAWKMWAKEVCGCRRTRAFTLRKLCKWLWKNNQFVCQLLCYFIRLTKIVLTQNDNYIKFKIGS